MDNNFDELKKIFKRIKNISINDSDKSKRIISDLKLESIDVAEFGDEIEKSFGINFLKAMRENPASNLNPLNYSIEELLKLINK
ncbi:MAG: hypothetical protein WC635_06950 [Bacteriovorax sp.]|jgi:acyl carrier protein